MTALNICVLTVSDTRTEANDTSGDALVKGLKSDGHQLWQRAICLDNIYQIRAQVSAWIAEPAVHAVVLTGGTGFYSRDSTPEAVMPLFDKQIEGFGELFRQVSYEEIGSSTIQSRALGGFANKTVVFCLPGSTGACLTGWNKIISEQLNSDSKPCNFVKLLTQ